MKLGWKTGRGFAPPKGGFRGWWFVCGWFRLELHPKWWRVGVSVTLWKTFGLYLGPLVLAVGAPQWRWHVLPVTTNLGSRDMWQDHAFTITVTTGVSNTDTKGEA